MARAAFIVLEGIDGSGSTTQGDRLCAWLRDRGEVVHRTREPSQGPAGMLLRLALSRRLRGADGTVHGGAASPAAPPPPLDPHTLALLYAADRMDHLATEVLPNLAAGRHVVCDRYLLSTLAYQGVTLGEEWLLAINRHAPPPDLCLYLDLDVDRATGRMGSRWTRELFEEPEMLRATRSRYRTLVERALPALGPIVTIDAAPAEEVVAAAIQAAVTLHLGLDA